MKKRWSVEWILFIDLFRAPVSWYSRWYILHSFTS
jgi:hypothetical protein